MMEQKRDTKDESKMQSCDLYFEHIQSRKKLPSSLQESLTTAFAKIPASSFPIVPRGEVVEIQADTSVADAVKILSENNIMAAPVVDSEPGDSVVDWRTKYLGIIDYSAVILWVLESANIAVVANGVAADGGVSEDATTATSKVGDDFYKVLQEEPFRSTKVRSIAKSFRSTPFLPVATDSSMLTVLLLLSKYRLRNVPVIERGKPFIKNFITQSAVVQGLEGCQGRDWFDVISSHPVADLGLPFMSLDEIISIQSDELVLEAFKRMKDYQVGGLPVVEGPKKKIIGNISMREIKYLLLKPDVCFNFRNLKVKEFIDTIASLGQEEARRVIPPVTCKPHSPLKDVVHTFASKKVHRIYVVAGEEGNELLGIITLRDVISCFIFEPPNHLESYYGFSVKEVLN